MISDTERERVYRLLRAAEEDPRALVDECKALRDQAHTEHLSAILAGDNVAADRWAEWYGAARALQAVGFRLETERLIRGIRRKGRYCERT